MRIAKRFFAAVGLLLAAHLPAAHALDLSFDRAVGMIMSESHDLKKADANMRKAEAALDSANAGRWFHIDGAATYMNLLNVRNPGASEVDLPPELGGLLAKMAGANQRVSIPDNIFMAGATITQPIYTFGKIGGAVDGLRAAIRMSAAGKELARREVRYAAAQLYWTAKMADGAAGIAEKSLKDALEARKKLTSAGRASRANLVKIEADIATKEINLSDARFNRDTAHRMLKIMAGVDADEELVLADGFPNEFGALDAGGMAGNPEWDMLSERAGMHEKNARSKRAGRMPTLAAMASYNYIATHSDYDMWHGVKSQNAYWGLSLNIPIFDGGLSRANATMEAMEAESARQDLDNSKKLKSEEYHTAVKRYEHLRENLSALNNARNLAEKAYGYSRDRFAAGQTSAVELSDVSDALSRMDMSVISAKYNLLMSAEQVKKLSGD
jgi:outer membrane protein TolC